MIRATSVSIAKLAIFPMHDVLGLDASHRMNVPGLMGSSNGRWRYDWPMVGSEPGRVLGLTGAATGRGPMAKLNLPGDVPKTPAPLFAA